MSGPDLLDVQPLDVWRMVSSDLQRLLENISNTAMVLCVSNMSRSEGASLAACLKLQLDAWEAAIVRMYNLDRFGFNDAMKKLGHQLPPGSEINKKYHATFALLTRAQDIYKER